MVNILNILTLIRPHFFFLYSAHFNYPASFCNVEVGGQTLVYRGLLLFQKMRLGGGQRLIHNLSGDPYLGGNIISRRYIKFQNFHFNLSSFYFGGINILGGHLTL